MVLLKVIITPIFLPKNADLGDWDRMNGHGQKDQDSEAGTRQGVQNLESLRQLNFLKKGMLLRLKD